jgi:hypothetical protein
MQAGDEIMIHGVFGDIAYKGEGLLSPAVQALHLLLPY